MLVVLFYIFLFIDNVPVVPDVLLGYTVLLRYLYNSTIHDSVFIWKKKPQKCCCGWNSNATNFE
jgi:hypothetical protein